MSTVSCCLHKVCVVCVAYNHRISRAQRTHTCTTALRIERPKVLYNAARRYYVLIFHLDSVDGTLGQVGWAVRCVWHVC